MKAMKTTKKPNEGKPAQPMKAMKKPNEGNAINSQRKKKRIRAQIRTNNKLATLYIGLAKGLIKANKALEAAYKRM